MSLAAEALLQQFGVYGRYYRARLGHLDFELRSRLEIFEHGLGWPEVAGAEPDLVAVMMNPGGSRPLAPLDAHGWAPAVPDRTQYQLMRLVLLAQSRGIPIRHIRVINLSDLRTPKSAELFAALATLNDDRHSLFCVQRQEELERALGSPAVPVLRAWGLAPALAGLAKRAVASTSSRKVFGLTNDLLHYRHPLPQRADLQTAWLEHLGRQLDAWGRASSRRARQIAHAKRDTMFGSPEGCPSG